MMSDQLSCTVTFWGVRGSTPCPDQENMAFGGNTTCVEINIPESDEQLILDSGTGIRKLGDKLAAEHDALKGRIFITHPHRDHIQGFSFFKPLYSAANHLTIHMPEQEQGGCEEVFEAHHSKTFFPVSLEMMNARLEFVDQSPARRSYTGFDIEYIRANHSTNTAIYKLHINGSQLVFAPDNELVPEGFGGDHRQMEQIRDFFEDVDVLIHDAQYNLDSYKDRRGWGHSAWEEVIGVARQMNVSKLILTHHDPHSTDDYLRKLDQQAQKEYGAYFDTVAFAKEGNTITL